MPNRRFIFIAIALILLTLGVYARVGTFDFTNFDDPDYVAGNEIVQRGLTGEGLRWAFTTNFMGNWHPLAWLSHMLDCQIFSLNPSAHHWINVLFHIFNTVLLFGVLRRYTGALERSAVVAALFAVHPLHVESVAWIAERKDVLSTLFWLLTMWAYLRFIEQRSTSRYLVVVIFFILGLMSKPMLVTLPFVLLLLDYWPLKRDQQFADWRQLLLEKGPLLLLAAASCVITFIVQKQGGAIGSFEKFSLAARVANALVAYVVYIGKTIFPDNLAPFYPHPGSWPLWQPIGAALVLVFVSTLALAFVRRAPYLLIGWLWYLGTLLPVIGLVQVGDQAYADRYTYIPLIGLFVAIVWAAADLAAHLRWPLVAARAVGIAAALIFASLAAVQVSHWRNSETLFRHAIAVTQSNYVAHYNLAQALSIVGRHPEAVEHYYATLQFKPEHEDAHNNLGLTCAIYGDWPKATNHYSQALRIAPTNADIHLNMGLAQLRLGRPSNALEHLNYTVKTNPRHALAHKAIGDAFLALQQPRAALTHYREAVRLGGRDAAPTASAAEALNNAAWILATHPDSAVRNGKEAVQFAERACQLTEYRLPQMLGTLAAAYAESGDFKNAVEFATKAESLATQRGDTATAETNRLLRQKYQRNKVHREVW